MSKESDFQAKLIKEIESRFPGSIVVKLDPRYKQGIPDLLILYKDKWATLECKRDENSSKRTNQPYYVKLMDEMSFSRFISLDNKKEVLDELSKSFELNE